MDLAWPRFSARSALNGRVQGLLLASLLNGDGAQKKFPTISALSKAFLAAARSDSTKRLTMPAARAAEVLPVVERAFRRERAVPPTSTLADAGYEFPKGSFTLDDATLAVCGSSLFVHWNAYAIAPYATGPTTRIIPLDSVPALHR